MLTIGVHRKVSVNHMVDALNFIQNQVYYILTYSIYRQELFLKEPNLMMSELMKLE